ncbi:MAG: methyltransferase domain-containing protein [Acidobacteriota bacterium]|nr:methyltransferase domain-containing protein [Acidobacteriota bacterium]
MRRFFGLRRQAMTVRPESDIASYILGFSSHSEEQKSYATTHLGRLVRTVEIVPKGKEADHILEMGAYMQITPALKSICGYGTVRGCYLGSLGRVDEKVVHSVSGEEFRCEIDLFDAERDIYPYPDGAFQTVICCELLEHLANDPMHLMAEVNRVLQTGGHFVLSTPNIASLRSVAAVLHRAHPGLYQQFIRPKNGSADPRHAREYTPDELRNLFEGSGFAVALLETGPYGLKPAQDLSWVNELLKQRGFSTDLRGETVHVLARKTGPVTVRYPAWLYD